VFICGDWYRLLWLAPPEQRQAVYLSLRFTVAAQSVAGVELAGSGSSSRAGWASPIKSLSKPRYCWVDGRQPNLLGEEGIRAVMTTLDDVVWVIGAM
jgi:hypothetical protein